MGDSKRIILAACVAAGSVHAQEGALSPEQLFERVAPSVWTIQTFDAQNQPLALGSGVVVAPGSVVTNCHVLRKAKSVTVGRENVSYGATLDSPDPERDLCLLKVRNFKAPPVQIGDPAALKTGARVYAIGSPRGLEHTISDGLLSGVRRSQDGGFTALQITVPISPGSSGGGLFDTHGRLVGITTFQVKEGQNLNFALPATWIAQVPERAKALLAAEATKKEAPPAATEQATQTAAQSGRVFEYRLTDGITQRVQVVTYQIDRIDGDRIVLNGGARVENTKGEVVSQTGAIGGEADLAMPPGGWFRPGAAVGARWSLAYFTQIGSSMKMDLEANVVGEERLVLAGRELKTLRIEFEGYTDRNLVLRGMGMGRYHATAWYAPELGRLVRFAVKSHGGTSTGQYVLEESLELSAIR